MAKGFKHGAGGGAFLNFKVVGNPQPEDPKENIIWVNTDVEITGWIFSETQPENPAEGMVWFPTGTSSTAPFNALKKNGIQVYPLSAKQYIGGAWVEREAKSYQNGAWVDWITYAFADGKVKLGKLYNGTPSLLYIDGDVLRYTSSGNSGPWGYFDKKVDLTNYSVITIIGRQTEVSFSDKYLFTVSVTKNTPTIRGPEPAISASSAYVRFANSSQETEYNIDVSKLSGEYYIELSGIAKGYVREIKIE